MLPDDSFAATIAALPGSGRWHGAWPAIVRDLADPDGQNRVRIALPGFPDAGDGAGYEAWARLATLFAGNNRGSVFLPDIGDEVLVVFQGGDPRLPCVIGGLWNGSDAPPVRGANANDTKQIRSRNGVTVTLDDAQGRERFVCETPGGQRVTLKDGPGGVNIEDANGNSIELAPAGVTLTASAKLTISAPVVEVSASLVTVSAGMSRFSGVVQADTVISNTVISATYTPGAGNIW